MRVSNVQPQLFTIRCLVKTSRLAVRLLGTGTIEKDGAVGDIGGAYLKVKSAADSGADIFFVPNNPVTKEMKKADPMPKLTIKRPRKLPRNWGPR